MRLTFVTPAWRRPAVTRLALAQRRWLCDRLSLRGITADCIVVADDENLDVAKRFGFQALELPNLLGYKINAGFALAREQEADYISFVGSDDWMHPDLFDLRLLDGETVVSGRRICLYYLATQISKVVNAGGPHGAIPWLIPVGALPQGKVIPDHLERGIDLALALALDEDAQWTYHDPHPLARVDFKSDIGMTPYGAGLGPVAPPLIERYPAQLVRLVDQTSMAVAA